MAKNDVAKNPYESKYNLIKYVSFFVVGLIILVLFGVFHKQICGFLGIDPNDIIANIILLLVPLSISAIIHIFWVSKHFDTVSTFYYMKNELKTNVTMADAAYIKRIFDPEFMKADSWVTLEGVLHLPENLRRKAAMDAAKKILSQPAKPVKKTNPTKTNTAAKPKTTTAQKPKTATKKK